MEKDARYFIVGLVVSIGMIALVGFVLWLAGTHESQDREMYTVYFTDPVSGLKEGASVQYRGVEVGKVLGVRLSNSREDLIKVDIAVKEATPIGQSTTASLEMFGITGLVYMELTTETERQVRRGVCLVSHIRSLQAAAPSSPKFLKIFP